MGSRSLLTVIASLAAAALALAAGGCGFGSDGGDEGSAGAATDAPPAGPSEPSQFARQTIDADLLRLYTRTAEQSDLDWAELAACDQVGIVEGLTEEPADRRRVNAVITMMDSPAHRFCTLPSVTELAERLRAEPGSANGAAAPPPVADEPLDLPADGRPIARFGVRFGVFHNGIDVLAPEGAEIQAAAPGIVTYAGSHPVYGGYSCLAHRFRPPLRGHRELTTCYGYQSRLEVELGDIVEDAQVIGYVGCTDSCARTVVHMQVRRGPHVTDELIDPAPLLDPDVGEIEDQRPVDA